MDRPRAGGVKRPHEDDDMPTSFEEELANMEMDYNDLLTQGGAEEGFDDEAAFEL